MPELRPNPRWAILACVLAAAACAPRPVAPPAAPAPADHAGHHGHHHGHHHAAELPATAGPGFTVADVRFMQHMIGHHAQAIVMAELAPERGASPSLLQLARKIDISQRDEIQMMKQWLAEREQAIPDEEHARGMTMPGMLTAEQLARLAAARGPEFDRLFLTLMIQHHEGALSMVEELFRDPRAGQDPDLFRFVTDVDADQRDEILVMERLLAALRG